MKRFSLMLTVLALAVPAFAQQFTAVLTGPQEVSGGDPDGLGLAVIDIDGTTVNYTILVQNINPPTAAHIHQGPAGVDGGIVVDLMPTFVAGNATGSVTASQSVIDGILANPGGFYVNVHTSDFPGGAIRGQLEAASSDTTVFPIVGSTPGANNTRFVTDLRVVNTEQTAVDVTIVMYESSSAGVISPSASATVTVQPGEQAVYDDVTGELLGQVGKAGALVLLAEGEITAYVRVINDQRAINEGTAGISVRGKDPSEATTNGVLPILSQASDADRGAGLGFRTNVGFFNPSSSSTEITFTAHATDGTVIGTKVVQVGSFHQQQQGVFALIDTVPQANRVQDDFYITWQAGSPVFVYATTVDNTTGDSVYVD